MQKYLLALMAVIAFGLANGQETGGRKRQSKGPFPADWVLVEKGGYFGFISGTGKEIIKPQYNRIHPFDEFQRGWAMVEKDGFLGFISVEGREIIKPQYTKIYPFGEVNRGWAMVEVNGKFGLSRLMDKRSSNQPIARFTHSVSTTRTSPWLRKMDSLVSFHSMAGSSETPVPESSPFWRVPKGLGIGGKRWFFWLYRWRGASGC
jgi:hypothetical protein